MRREPHWQLTQPEALWQPTWPIDPGCGSDEFAEFVDQVTRRGGFLRDMYRLYTGRGTQDEIDFIGKSERLQHDVCQVFDTIGVGYHPEQLKFLHSAGRGDVYTPELEAMVVHAEQETFSDYGYRAPSVPAELLRARRQAYPQRVSDIPGWFDDLDRATFRRVLRWQTQHQPPGDLVELGCYLGKSTVVVGEWLRPGETFTVCDLFGDEAGDSANAAENRAAYESLSRQGFERYYQWFRRDLPVIHQALTSEILDHVAADSARFVHVDASHLYEHVTTDIASARTMLRHDGVVVFDDYRSEHTPGVAAAVWQEMATGGLRPIAMTPMKWYGTWGDPEPAKAELRSWLANEPRYAAEEQSIGGADVLRLYKRRAAQGSQPAQIESGYPKPARTRPTPLTESARSGS
jgi:predicted O-methyltransferase YrrM